MNWKSILNDENEEEMVDDDSGHSEAEDETSQPTIVDGEGVEGVAIPMMSSQEYIDITISQPYINDSQKEEMQPQMGGVEANGAPHTRLPVRSSARLAGGK